MPWRPWRVMSWNVSGKFYSFRALEPGPPVARRERVLATPSVTVMPKPASLTLLPLLLVAAPGCDRKDVVHQIQEERTYTPDQPLEAKAYTTAERLGFTGGGHGHGAPAAAPARPFVWTLPADWEEMPGSSMRQGSFRVKGIPESDISLTLLPGGGGGMAANVNRWRKQMGLPDLSEADVAALPKRTFLGQQATYLDLRGTYSAGMGDPAPKADYAMLGVILVVENTGVFAKFTGPARVADTQKANFDAFCASVRANPAATPGGNAAPPGPEAGKPALQWTAPEGWRQTQQGSGMRLVTFVMGATGKTECAVTILGGTGGGMKPNLDRWNGQVGKAALTEAEFLALPRIPVLGGQGVLLHAEGAYSGMEETSIPDQALLGLAVELPGQMVFVKMTGPKSEVAAERARFEAFCKSLRR